jgi:hypothetical protein
VAGAGTALGFQGVEAAQQTTCCPGHHVPAAQALMLPEDWGTFAASCALHQSQSPYEKRAPAKVATDYDEVRSDVKESQQTSLEALQSANAPDARSVVLELDEADGLDGAGVPGGEFIAEELIVQVIPQAEDEFTCYSCFLVRHRSQLARESNGRSYCIECEG